MRGKIAHSKTEYLHRTSIMPSTLIGSASRYISGRNAVQTVYWIKPSDGNHHKFLKLSKTCTFRKSPNPPQKIKDMLTS
ncbi:hypothetical protein D910_08543 [Dendroctonus ponderosae]